ncbi:hypothetical protein M2333_002647 [Sphingobium sp. B11D3B]|uniref:PEPxxWA-CTERM sorting domain-containing protein n=1 Tax=Sphingobium sp. B11D3B TaxID=2940575 RepID=UPI002227DB03|nr:PEPxxWA-CTERM sorting domain-containing protein [Sphingobium sp. B11D3B]MCW2389601.1 hypothetical protein [Sphingobium sp. B11D3B]
MAAAAIGGLLTVNPAFATTTVYQSAYQTVSIGWGADAAKTVGQTFVAPGDALLSWSFTTSSNTNNGLRFVVFAFDQINGRTVGPELYSSAIANVVYERNQGLLELYTHTFENINLNLATGYRYAAFITSFGAPEADSSYYLALGATPTAPNNEQLTGSIWFSPDNAPATNVNYSWLNGKQANVTAVFGTPSSAVAAVPEPASWAMMLVGFGAIGFSMRDRRRKSSVRFA